MRFLILFLPCLVFADETVCKSVENTKKYCLVSRDLKSDLLCEVYSRSATNNFSDKTSLWRAFSQADYCDKKYHSFLKDIQTRGWNCDATQKGETPSCSVAEQIKKTDERKIASKVEEISVVPEIFPQRILELGIDFTNDLLTAESPGGQGQYAPRYPFPSLLARYAHPIGDRFRVFGGGRIHYLEYYTRTSDVVLENKQWHWRLQAGADYQATQKLRPELSFGFSRHTFVTRIATNELIFEGLSTAELGAAVRVGNFDTGLGEFGAHLGAYYLFSATGSHVAANSGYAFRGTVDYQKEFFTVPTSFGIHVERIIQDTSNAGQSAWVLGLAIGAIFEMLSA